MNLRGGASTGCAVDRPILGILDLMSAAGIAAVEVSTPPGHFDPWQFEQVEALRNRLHADRIEPVSVHAPFGGLLDLSDPNPHHRHAAIGAIMTAAMALKEIGGRILVVHTTDVPRHGQDVGRRLDDCARSLGLLQRLCRNQGVELAIESPLPHLIGGDAGEFDWLLRQVGPDARVCLDTSHITLGRQWPRFVEVTRGRVIHVHANDHRGDRDDHLPPGDGHIDWGQVGESLRSMDYRGWIILELGCPGQPDPELFRRAARQLAERLGPAPARAATPCTVPSPAGPSTP